MSVQNSFEKRKTRVRRKIKIKNRDDRPRLVVSRSNKNISAQLINKKGEVITAYSSLAIKENKDNKIKGVELAALVGQKFTELSIAAKVKKVVFDKGAYLYNGRVKALAEACRKAGLEF